MRMSRRMGLYGGKRSSIVSVYGAKNETVTLTHEKGTKFTATTNASGYGGEIEIPFGSYTVAGNVSNFSKQTVINKYTKTVEAWPDTATIYYWYGFAPLGEFTAINTLPNTSPYTSSPVAPIIEPSTSNVSIRSSNETARGGTAYLPKTAIRGTTLTLECSGATNNYYLALNLAESVNNNNYSPAKVKEISTGDTKITIDISAISGGEYFPAISMNTNRNAANPSRLVVNALYSVGETEDVTLDGVSATIATNDTYRYGSALQATSGFAKVSSLTFGAINYVGQGDGEFNAMMIPLSGFDFSGKSVWLKLKMWVMTSSSTNHTFRWAITKSRANEAVYKGSGAVTDANQLAQGTINTTYTSGNFSWQTFLLECENIPANTPLYLYLWRNNTTYGNIHVMDNITVTLDYAKN